MANSRRVAVIELVGGEPQILRICKDRTDTTKFLQENIFKNHQNSNAVTEEELRDDVDSRYIYGGTLRTNPSYSVAKVLCENDAGGILVRIILGSGGQTVSTRFLDENDNVTMEQLGASFKMDLQTVAKTQVIGHVPFAASQAGFLSGDILLQRPENPKNPKTHLQLCDSEQPCSAISEGHVGRCLRWKGPKVMAPSPAVSGFGSPWSTAPPQSTGTARSRRAPLSASKKANATALFGSHKPPLAGSGTFSFTTAAPAPAPAFGQFSLGATAAPATASAFSFGGTSGTAFGGSTGTAFGSSTSAFGSGTTFGSPVASFGSFGMSKEAPSSLKTPGKGSLSKASSSSRKTPLGSVSFAPQSNTRKDTPKPKLTASSVNSDLLGSLSLDSKKTTFGAGLPTGTPAAFGTGRPVGAFSTGQKKSAFNAAVDGSGSSTGRFYFEESDDDEDEVEEERKKARKVFFSLATYEDGHAVVGFSQLEDLFSALGGTYCDEEYGDELKMLANEPGKLRLNEFLSWYITSNLLFADNYSTSEEEDDDEGSSGAASGGPSWGDLFKKSEVSWKCRVCMLQNNGAEADAKCRACEEPRFVLVNAVASSTAAASSSSAVFPPLSAKAPTPFGASSATTTGNSSKPANCSSAAFPPVAHW